MGGWRLDPEGAKAYERFKQFCRTGEAEDGRASRDCSLKELANLFLASKAQDHASGELSPRTYSDYDSIVRAFVAAMGKNRHAGDLRPGHFADYRKKLAKRLGPHALNRHVVSIRHFFAWADDTIEGFRSPKLKRSFQVVPVMNFRRHKRESGRTHGKKIFSTEEVRRLLSGADHVLRAMILLGINCSMGNTDIARLEAGDIDFDRDGGAVLDTERSKTEVRRIAPLWAETARAVRDAIALRPRPASGEADLGRRVFLHCDGRPVVREVVTSDADGIVSSRERDWIQERFADLMDSIDARALERIRSDGKWSIERARSDAARKSAAKALAEAERGAVENKMRRHGRSFYSLRRTHRTIADEMRDDRACAVIMGHAIGDIADLYIWEVAGARLKAITDHLYSSVLEGWSEPTQSAPT